MSKIMEKATETSGFLDGRDYTAAFLYEFFSLIVGNGVYANELTPTATNENMTITHGTGHAWINGVCYKNTIPFVLDIATADGVLNRYDSLMLRLNLSINEAYAIIVQGDYAESPTPPAVTRNAEIFDLKICDIFIPAGCTKITQAQITDTRLDSSVCGVPVFPVEHLDMTTFYQQVAADLDSLKQKEQAEILALLEQLNYLVESDTVGKLIAEVNTKTSLIVSDTIPTRRNVLWFDTSRGASANNDVALLSLDEDESGYPVTAEVEGETYGVGNATVNAGASGSNYDFTVL